MKLKVLDLFSGIGGFSVGLERTGYYETVAFCEIDKYCKLLLQKHWKGIKIYDDVKKITKEGFQADGIPSPDVITGGFPCQPFSVAGKQKGTRDDRHLWPEMFRIIQAFKPRFVIGENVRGIINIQDGVVFEAVCTDLESEGYEVQPFLIPAAGVGAPHRRERVWIIAIREESMVNSDNVRFEQHIETEEEASRRRSSATFESTGSADVANTEGERLQRSRREESSGDFHGLEQDPKRIESEIRSEAERRSGIPADVADTESFSSDVGGREEHQTERDGQRKIRGEDSTDASNTHRTGSQRLGSEHELRNSEKEKQTRRISWWDIEPNVGRVAHGVSGRVHRLKGLGNAIVPQIAETIGRAIIKAMK